MLSRIDILLLSVLAVTCVPSNIHVSSTMGTISRECSQAGLLCTDCKTLSICLPSGTGYKPNTVRSCDDYNPTSTTLGGDTTTTTGGTTTPGGSTAHDGPTTRTESFCSESLLNCSSTKLNPCMNNDEFTCHSQGLFPDPYDCNVYYECAKDSAKEYAYNKVLICPAGKGFNPLSGECSLSMNDPVCKDSPVPQCNKNVIGGPLTENPNMYYICIDSKPKIYKCPDGEAYNANTYACEPTAFICPGEGTYADPQDCHKYYTCSTTETPKHKSCFFGFYFDAAKKRCVLGIC